MPGLILGADGKPVRKPEPSPIERLYRRNLREAEERLWALFAHGAAEDRVRALRKSCGLPVADPFAYITKEEEE